MFTFSPQIQTKVEHYLRLIFAVLILLSFFFSLNLALYGFFSIDSLQHTHIAWNILQGKILYKDFFEHHGPAFAFINSFILYLLGDGAASFDTLRLFRVLSVCYGLTIVYLLARISFSLTQNKLSVLTVCLLFVSMKFFAIGNYQSRPDQLQTICLLLGLFFILRNKFKFAGYALGLGVHFNAKALIPFAAIVSAGIIVDYYFEKKPLKVIYKEYYELILPVILIHLIFVSVFLTTDSLGDFYFSTIKINFTQLFQWKDPSAVNYRSFDLFEKLGTIPQIILVLSVVFAAYNYGKHGLSKCTSSQIKIILITICLSPLLLAPLHGHGLLMIVPYALIAISLFNGYLRAVIIMLTLSLAFQRFISNAENYQDPANPGFNSQRDKLNRMLEISSRDEPVAYFWPSVCATFVFNADSQYHWMIEAKEHPNLKRNFGYDPREKAFQDLIFTRKIKYLVISPKVSKDFPDYHSYWIENNYQDLHCLQILK